MFLDAVAAHLRLELSLFPSAVDTVLALGFVLPMQSSVTFD